MTTLPKDDEPISDATITAAPVDIVTGKSPDLTRSPCCLKAVRIRATELISRVRLRERPHEICPKPVRAYCTGCGDVLRPDDVKARLEPDEMAADASLDQRGRAASAAIATGRIGSADGFGLPEWSDVGVMVAIRPFARGVLWDEYDSPKYTRPDLLRAKIAELLGIPAGRRATRIITAPAIGDCEIDFGTVDHIVSDKRRQDVNHLRLIPALPIHLGDPIEIWWQPAPTVGESPKYVFLTAYRIGDTIKNHVSIVLDTATRKWVLTAFVAASVTYTTSQRTGRLVYARYAP